MTIKIIFIGDPHFQVTNIQEVENFIEKITELASDIKPDIICIGGDILHTHERLHTMPLNKAYEFIDKMRKISKTYVLVGNHDMTCNQNFLNNNHWMNGMKEWENTVIVDKVITEILDEMLFTFVPYVPPGRFEEALNTLKETDKETDWLDSKCIFAHQEFFGCKMGAIISVEGDKWSLDNPNVISGHIHSKQKPQKNIYYTGSAMQHAFGESEKNIIACLEFDKNNNEYSLNEVDLKLPRKKIVYIDVEKVDEYNIPDNTEDKIKISVSGSQEQFKALKKTQKYKKLVEDGVKVVFKEKKSKYEKEISESIVNETMFKKILNEMINNEKDNYLYQAYELVINNKKINNDDVIFL